MARIGFEGVDDASEQLQGTATTVMSTLPTDYSGSSDKSGSKEQVEHRRSQSSNDVLPNEITVQRDSHVARLNERRQRSDSVESIHSVHSV